MIDREALAWAAGIYEGEGTICRARGGRFLAINMTDEDVLIRFRDAIGFGVIGGPYRPGKNSKKPYWTWRVCNFQHRQAVTAMLWRWLSPRRQEQLTGALAMDKRS